MPDWRSSAAVILRRGCDSLALDIDAEIQAALLDYLELLERWNSAYNLTAVRDPLDMVTRHLLDSLAVLPHLPVGAGRLVDVGTGAGLPGVPLALCLPEREFDLLDSNGKKTRFLFQVKTHLGLANMQGCHARAEQWQPPRPYQVVLSRAFASLAAMLDHCAHLCHPDGCFLAMKGGYPAGELDEVAGRCAVTEVHELVVPGLEEARHLVELKPLQADGRGT